jgi:hypothetical protein
MVRVKLCACVRACAVVPDEAAVYGDDVWIAQGADHGHLGGEPVGWTRPQQRRAGPLPP